MKDKRFNYTKRRPTNESVAEAPRETARAVEYSGDAGRLYKEGVNFFAPKSDSFEIRILPPMWEGATSWALPIEYYFGLAGDNGFTLSRRFCYDIPDIRNNVKGLSRECPIYERYEALSLMPAAIPDYHARIRKYAPKRAWLCYVLDMSENAPNARIYRIPAALYEAINNYAAKHGFNNQMPFSLFDKDIGAALRINKRGYDFDIESHIVKPLSDCGGIGVLDAITTANIPSILNFADIDTLRGLVNDE